MIDEERAKAERRAEIVTCPACASSWSQGEGRDEAIEAERERSRKLAATLQNIRDEGYAENYITQALREYESK